MVIPKISGMPGFAVLWLSQASSLLGGSMAGFAITLWICQQTGKATPVTMLEFYSVLPMVIFTLFAGVLVDRHSRRLLLILGDVASLVINIFIALLFVTGHLEVWHLYISAFVVAIFQTFQWPALSAIVTGMVDKTQYARTASMLNVAVQFSGIFAPILAGTMMSLVGLSGVLVLTLLACAFSVLGTFCVDIPEVQRDTCGPAPSVKEDLRESFRFLASRKPLLYVQALFLFGNFFFALSFALLGPYILGRSGNDALMYSSVVTASAVGGIAGSCLIATTGGIRDRVTSINFGWAGGALLGLVVMGLADSRLGWMCGSFLESFLMSFVSSANQSLWQSKVPSHLQGRVFSLRRLIAQMVVPLSSLIAGPLVDHLLEPAMLEGGVLAAWFGGLIRPGHGAGIGLLFVISGLAVGLVNLLTLFVPVIRHADSLVPDTPAGKPGVTVA